MYCSRWKSTTVYLLALPMPEIRRQATCSSVAANIRTISVICFRSCPWLSIFSLSRYIHVHDTPIQRYTFAREAARYEQNRKFVRVETEIHFVFLLFLFIDLSSVDKKGATKFSHACVKRMLELFALRTALALQLRDLFAILYSPSRGNGLFLRIRKG